jgi:hypothetical protein
MWCLLLPPGIPAVAAGVALWGLHTGFTQGPLTGIASRAASVIAGARGMRPARSEHSWRGGICRDDAV